MDRAPRPNLVKSPNMDDQSSEKNNNTASLQLAVLKLHTDLQLILYLLLVVFKKSLK